jgi:glycosyltransferase involved in cell wall biosynthesis
VNIIVTGGFEANFTLGFAKGLRDNGLRLLVVSCDETERRLTAAGIANANLRGSLDKNRPWAAKLLNLLRYYWLLVCLLLRHRGATVHFTGVFRNQWILWEGIVLNLIFRGLARRYIYTVHNVLPHSRERSYFYVRIYRAIYRVPHVLLVHTERARQQLVAEFGVPRARIELTSIGVNEEIPTTELSRSEARSRLSLAEDDQVILFFGKIAEYKGLDLLLDAFDELDLPKPRLLIAGEFRDLALRDQIYSQWQRMHRSKEVFFHERHIANDEVEVFVKACDVLSLPYRYIYQSGVVFLGMRFGVPMVTTDVGSLCEFVDEDVGIVASSNDAVGIAGAIEAFFANPGRFSRARILDGARKFQWAKICRDLVPLYTYASHAHPGFSGANVNGDGLSSPSSNDSAGRHASISSIE